MTTRISRRKVLLSTLISGKAMLAGCLSGQQSAEVTWQQEDDFPDDADRNRECSMQRMDGAHGSVSARPNELEYSPYAYSISGRDNIHGTNQHIKLEVETDADADVLITNQEDAARDFHSLYDDEEGWSEPSTIIKEGESTEQDPYETEWTTPDDEEHFIIVMPPDGDFDEEISVTLNFECSYYLPLEEFKDMNSITPE